MNLKKVNKLQFLLLFMSTSDADGMLDIIFVIDSSGSIRSEQWSVIINFIVQIVSQLEVHILELLKRLYLKELQWLQWLRLQWLQSFIKYD